MKSTTLLLILSAGALFAQSGEPDRLMEALEDRAMADQIARMKTDQRISVYEALIAHKAGNLHYQNLLATAFIQKMRDTTDAAYLDRAAKLVDGVLAAESGNYEALRLRSQIELERHNFDRVAENSRQLTRQAPDDPWNWGTLGDALMELGDYGGAAEAYQKMVSLRPDLASYNRASYYRFVTGDAEGAIAVMKQAIAAGSRSAENVAWCLVDLGNLYWKTGRLAEAERAYQAALNAFPGYHPAHFGLGRVHAAQGKTPSAIEHLKRAQAAVPLVEYAAALEDLYSAAGRSEEARGQRDMIDMVDRLERANNQTANRALAMVYADHDRKLDRALDLAEAELKVRKDIYTYDALAWALYKNKRYAEAAQAAERALRLGTPEPGFYYHAGMIAGAVGNKEEARKHLEKALAVYTKLDPRQAPLAEAALKEARQ
ncbi:MAG: tetratricopeptide repeat protein [Acidobacteria bacterium]|nr:tetratricopeptide repeat protein [Acidobacteriota bacterium]